MFVKRSIKLSQKGDTILEVLIAVAVLSLILASSFTLANRSTKATRQANERGEAAKIAQSEIESLKYFLKNSTAALPSDGSLFCVDISNPTSPTIISAGGSLTVANLNTTYNMAANECKHGTDGRYVAVVNKTGDVYDVYVRWDSLGSSGIDEINFSHRVYPESGFSAPYFDEGGDGLYTHDSDIMINRIGLI